MFDNQQIKFHRSLSFYSLKYDGNVNVPMFTELVLSKYNIALITNVSQGYHSRSVNRQFYQDNSVRYVRV